MSIKRAVVVLAAGRGTRMHSTLPKMLQPIAGVPLLGRLLSTISQLNAAKTIVVYGAHGEALQQALDTEGRFIWVEQHEALGTAHAVSQALPHLDDCDQVLICYGDVPLIRLETLNRLLSLVPVDALGFMTMTLPNPQGYGRVLRDNQGSVLRIVEEVDASVQEKRVQEVNAGFFVVPCARVREWMPSLLNNAPANAEHYLTDMVAMAHTAGIKVHSIQPIDAWEISGVNDKEQLAVLERHFQRSEAKRLMQQGVTLLDPDRFDLRGEVTIGRDVTIDINVLLEGAVRIGNNVVIGPHVSIKDSTLGDGVRILAHTVIDGATIGQDARVGPFARLRPGTVLWNDVKIGNFVELKNTRIGFGSKVNHLSYVGDALLGSHVNIGAGAITCNYDGHMKHQTTIEDKAHIGANTSLIAPLTIGYGTVVGAGTILKGDVAAGQRIHNRVQHRIVDNIQPLKDLEPE
jgi:bifunctional UDP-N-acetylglucosamine pyrophosphorylase / glucosamine-1-phosphate N-acetyltransferase